MTTQAILDHQTHRAGTHRARAATEYLVPLGRFFFVAIFLLSGPRHFATQTIEYARQAGVPAAGIAVPLAGIIALLGGLSILLGYKAKLGAWLLVLFLVPVTVMMHRFWGLSDPHLVMLQQVNFMKNLSMLGAALMIAHFGSGPISIDARRSDRH